jgi:hypothetical protein
LQHLEVHLWQQLRQPRCHQLPLLVYQLLLQEQIINTFFQLPLRLVLSEQLLLQVEI